jgi:ParB/RepB/Spo0J family partition protein
MTAATVDRDRNGPRSDPLGDAELLGGLRRIEITQLVESPWNPRKHFDAEQLEDLADSLRKGQLAPIIVRPIAGKHERYEIGAGHRRYRAAPLAGLNSLLAIVRDLDDVAFLELLTIENKQREDIAPLDEANGFRLLMEKAGYDVAKLAARIGLSTKYVYDRIKLLQLIPAAKKLLEDGTITAGHAIIIARLTPADQKRAIGDRDDADAYSMNSRTGGVFRPEEVEGELDLKSGAVGVRSVRELQQWVTDNVRFTENYADPMLFPETFETLKEVHETQDKVVHITHDFAVGDGARDPNMRTYGYQSWKRADGHKGSKKCERSVIGLVVAGEHQGDAYRVCVNKHRCKVHWKAEASAYERRQKEAKNPRPRAARAAVPRSTPTRLKRSASALRRTRSARICSTRRSDASSKSGRSAGRRRSARSPIRSRYPSRSPSSSPRISESWSAAWKRSSMDTKTMRPSMGRRSSPPCAGGCQGSGRWAIPNHPYRAMRRRRLSASPCCSGF